MKQKIIIKAFVFLVNLVILLTLIISVFRNLIIMELFLALIFLQILINAYLLFNYYIYKRAQILAKKMKFQFLTLFNEQPRLEGVYKKNWWQIHFASRFYGEYWGSPRTYIKLQFKDKKSFKKQILSKYSDYAYKDMSIDSVDLILRPYKNYLLMKAKWYLFNKKEIHQLMDLLLKIAKEAEIKK